MRTENLLNHPIFGFRSIRGYYQWFKTKQNAFLHSNNISFADRMWCIRHGFSPNFIKVIGREEMRENYKSYLTTKEYFKMHPFNGVYSFWIDDKLSTKYVFSKYDNYLPKYYFQIEKNKILRLYDCESNYSLTSDGIIRCIDDNGSLAFKRMIGSCGKGFYRIDKKGSDYYILGKKTSMQGVKSLIDSLEGYLVMECVQNCNELSEIFSGSLNTIRILYSNIDGDPKLMSSFIRFGNSKSDGVDNASAGGIECVVDIKTGETIYAFQKDSKGYAFEIKEHPDTNKSLMFKVPKWNEINKKLSEICMAYPQLTFLGFDVAVTPDEFKIIEINSLSGLEYVQAKRPLCADSETLNILRKFGLKR